MNHPNSGVRFTEEDVRLFSEASGDHNPLHLLSSYASRTAYGERVVFGALGALVCLGHVQCPESKRIARVTADFHRPMFLNVDYQIKVTPQGEGASVQLLDGTVPLVTVLLTFAGGSEPQRQARAAAQFERSVAAEWKLADLKAGMVISGRYGAEPGRFRALVDRWHVSHDAFVAETLLWSSYFIGMEMPGRDALFFRFALDFNEVLAATGPFEYEATLARINAPISQLRIAVVLTANQQRLAAGQLVSFIRPQIEPTGISALRVSDAFAGKVALVIGASRGLGAAISSALALAGAQVIAVSRSDQQSYAPEVAGRIASEIGDAADQEWIDGVRERIVELHGRLDFLICSAFPAIPSLRLERNALPRIEAYLTKATSLVLAPLCTFLELLDESGGCSVVVSSVAVEKPVRDWPHYIAAKNAIEGIARVAPLQYPRTRTLIVRPERLLTEMTNTPMGRQNARSPNEAAAQIVARLLEPLAAGSAEVFWCGADPAAPTG